MEMLKSHIQKHSSESKPDNKDLDLDERIRRIQEKNKAREKRFKEIEDDKLKASRDIISDEKSKQEKAMKGVIAVGGKKMAKGRGQRLLEMSKEPLKAKEFELRARGSPKKIEKCNQPEESKCLTQPPKENKRVELGGHEKKKEKKESLPNTVIPSVGFNPLMDHRYIDKKDVSKRRGDHRVRNEIIQTRGGQRGNFNGFAGYSQKQDRPKLREAQGSGWKPVKLNNSQRKALEEQKCSEDRDIDVMDVGKLKTECSTNRKLEVSEQTKVDVSTGSDIHEEDTKKNTNLPENTDTNEHNASGHDEQKTITSLGEICDKFHDQAVLQDKNKNLPDRQSLKADRNKSREVLTGESDSQQTIMAIPEEQEKSFEVKELPSTEDEVKELPSTEDKVKELPSTEDIKSTNQEKKPKITVNTKMKKTLSNSSFDDSISMLSPLDVPKDWGDCDFDESLGEVPSMFYQQTLTFN